MRKDGYFLNKHRGVLIVVEGISGSGKSVGIRELLSDLQCAGIQIVPYEWNSIPFLRKLTQRIAHAGLLTTNVFSMLQWIGFLYDYFIKIRPHLKKQHVIVADRYYYTGLTRDAANGAWKWPGRMLCRWLRQPDWLFFCETEAAICYERIQQRGKPLFHTNKKIHRDTSGRDKELLYLELMYSEYVHMLDKLADRPINIVTMGKEPASLAKSLVQYIYDKQGIQPIPHSSLIQSGEESIHGLVEASRHIDEENHHSDRHVGGGTQGVKSMAD